MFLMHWFKNGEYSQCCRGWPSEESRGWGWDASFNRAEEEELQRSFGFCQTDPLANCGFLSLLIPLPHHRVCLLLHHSMSCQTTVSHFLEQNFPRSRFAQLQVSLVGRPQICGNLWGLLLFSTATYDFLATEDTNRDKVKDILFVLRSSEGSQNNTCTEAGKTSIFNNTLGCTKR